MVVVWISVKKISFLNVLQYELKHCRVCSIGKYRAGKRRNFQVASAKRLVKRHEVGHRHTEKGKSWEIIIFKHLMDGGLC